MSYGPGDTIIAICGACYYLKYVNLDNVDHHKDVGVIVDDHSLFK